MRQSTSIFGRQTSEYNLLYKHLRRRGRSHKKRGALTNGRGFIKNRVDIDKRPTIVDKKYVLVIWKLSTSAHTATHSINGSAHETQNFSAGITENKKRGNKHCQQTHLTPPNIHDIVESRLRISQEGAHHLGCGLFLWYPFVVSEEKGETI